MPQTKLLSVKSELTDRIHSDDRLDMKDINAHLERISAQLDRLLRGGATSAPNQLVTVAEASRLLGVSERVIRKRLARKDWPLYRCGRAVRVNPQEIMALMQDSSPAQRKHG